MNTQASNKGMVPILAVIVALLVVGALVAYTYSGTKTKGGTSPSSNSSSATETSAEWTYFNSTISPEGLQVELALNTTSLLAGKGLSAEVYLTNTLPRNVTLSANLTAFPGDPALEALGRGSQCDGAGLLGMLNFGLYQGHYTAANFSQEAVPLILEAPVAHTCPNPYYYVQSPPQSVEFAPNSDMATVSGQKTMGMHLGIETINCTAGTYKFGPSTVVVNGSTTTSSGGTGLSWDCGPAYEGAKGYWAPPDGNYVFIDDHSNSTILQGLNSAYSYYQVFTPGSYTIVAEDLWNQTVFAYFEVSVSSSTNSVFAQSTRDAVNVTFYQLGACSPQVYTTPWLVRITGTTQGGLAVNESQELPPGADLSIYNSGGFQASTAGGWGEAHKKDGAYHDQNRNSDARPTRSGFVQ